MMQNSVRFADLTPERFRLAASQGCRRVARARRLESLCYENLGAVAAMSFGHDSRRATSLCRRLQGRLRRSACFAGVRDEVDESRRERDG